MVRNSGQPGSVQDIKICPYWQMACAKTRLCSGKPINFPVKDTNGSRTPNLKTRARIY